MVRAGAARDGLSANVDPSAYRRAGASQSIGSIQSSRRHCIQLLRRERQLAEPLTGSRLDL
jgi:hypothetical protein